MEDGVCNDQNCKLKHPELCYSIWYQSQCSRRDCKFVHPRNIQRKQRRNQDPRAYNAKNKYHENYGYDNEGFFWLSTRPMEYENANEGENGSS